MTQPFILTPPDDLLTQTPELGRMASDLSRRYANHEVVSKADLQNIGQALWQALNINEEDFQESLSGVTAASLPLILRCAHSAIQQLPWECLHHPKFGFLGTHPRFTLSRQQSIPSAVNTPPLRKGPLKVLLFTALPDDLHTTARLDTEAEQAQVLEALLPWIGQGLVELETPDDGRFSSLQQLLNQGEFHLVFLSGHGHFHHQPHAQSAYGEFLFESESGLSEPIRDEVLAEAFVNSGVQCVVLSACESGKAASDQLAAGLTQHLQQLGLPHVIGMRESVLDQAGIVFARAFCDAVGQKKSVDVALQQARQAIMQEVSVTQWCLPMLYSRNPAQSLIDWDFEAHIPDDTQYKRELDGIVLPALFIGRRRELRSLGPAFYAGKPRQLLITGPGGQGKTTLAGQLALRLKAQGYLVLAYRAQQNTGWEDFIFNLQLTLDPAATQAYESKRHLCDTPEKHAKLLFTVLGRQTQHKWVLFFDNLESIQHPDTRALEDPQVEAWINTALAMGESGPHLLLTSRWVLPDWPTAAHIALSKPSYGDFLRYLQQIKAQSSMTTGTPLRQVYDALGGNFRGLEFFLKAAKTMGGAEEQAYLTQLAQAQEDLQTNMAIERVFSLISEPGQKLLHRLCVYADSVPWDGVFKLAQDLAEPEALLDELTDFSLTGMSVDDELQRPVFQNDTQVSVWVQHRQGALDIKWYRSAAEYQMYLFETDRKTERQALVAHQALVSAGMTDEANVFVDDYLIEPFTLRGLYHVLLETWLPPLRASNDPAMKATGLNYTGKLYLHIGDYDTALDYWQQSLVIRKAIGDKQGEGTTLNNISQVYDAQGDYDTALDYLQQSLAIRKAIGDKQGEGTTLNNISQVYQAQGDYDTALDYLQQSLAIGDKQVEGSTLNNISGVYQAQGDYDTALDYLQQSLAILKAIGDKQGEGTTLNNIATAYQAQGDYDTALDYLQQSLAILKAIGDKPGEGSILNNISQVYKAQGNYDTALDYLQQSLAIRKAIGDKQGEGTTLNNISLVYDAQGDYETARDYLQQSLAIRKAIGDKRGEGITLNNISQVYKAQGDYETALDYLQQSLAIQKAIGDWPGMCATLFNIGHIQLQHEQTQAANATFVSVYELAKRINEFRALEALTGLAKQLGGEGLSMWEGLLQASPVSEEHSD